MLMKAAWLWLLSKIKNAEQFDYVRERCLCKRVQRDVCEGNPFNPPRLSFSCTTAAKQGASLTAAGGIRSHSSRRRLVTSVFQN